MLPALDYQAVESCPSASDWAERAAREDGAPLGPFIVRIEKSGAGFLGRIARNEDAPVREVRGESCADVAEALAVIARTSLPAEPAAAEPGASEAPESSPSPERTPERETKPPRPQSESPVLYAGLLVEGGSGPAGGASIAMGGEAELEARWSLRSSGSLRLGYEHGFPGVSDHIRASRHTFPLTVCPWAGRPHPSFFVGPCASTRIGWVRAEGVDVGHAESHNLFWLEAGLMLRAGLDTDFSRISLEIGTFFPLVQHKLVFGDPTSPAVQREVVPVGIRGGLALSLPIL